MCPFKNVLHDYFENFLVSTHDETTAQTRQVKGDYVSSKTMYDSSGYEYESPRDAQTALPIDNPDQGLLLKNQISAHSCGIESGTLYSKKPNMQTQIARI